MACNTKKLACKKGTRAQGEAETREGLETPADIQNAVPLVLTNGNQPILPRYVSEKIPLCPSAGFSVSKTRRGVINL